MQATTSKLPGAAIPKDFDQVIRSGGPQLVSDCPHQFFDSIARLPNLNRIFYDRSVDLIAREGLAAWHAQGGRLNHDGRPTFGNRSPIASQVLLQLANQFAGFHYTDDIGVPWCICWTLDQDQDADHWRAIAIGGSDCLWFLLSRRTRNRWAARLRQEYLGRQQFRNSASQEAEAFRRRLRSRLLSIRLFDGAPRMLPIIYRAAKANSTHEVEIDEDKLSLAIFGSRAGGPFTSGQQVHDGLLLLRELTVRVLDLPKTGWYPQHVRETRPFTALSWSPQTFRIGLAPEFIKFLDLVFRQSKPSNYSRAHSRNGAHEQPLSSIPKTSLSLRKPKL